MHQQPTNTTIAITPADEHTIKHSPLASFEIQKSHSVAASERSHGHVQSTPVVHATTSAVIATNHINVIQPQNHAPRQTSHASHTSHTSHTVVVHSHEVKTATEAHHRHSVTKYDHDHYDLNEAVKGIAGWKNITPANRHGVEMQRQSHAHELVHCLVVEHSIQSQHDLAHLEFLDLNQLPSTYHRHEIYSVCISKDVNQIQWIRDPINHPTVTTKVLFFGDHSMWTEQQVNAVTLMMHATLRPGALKTGLRDDRNVKQAEIFADQYCRTVGVQRTELLKLHTSGVPSRVSKCCVENVKSLPPNRTSHTAGTVVLQSRSPSMASNSATFVRADSQRAVAFKRANTIEHGGVSRTVVVTPTGEHESLDLISHASKIPVHPLSSSSVINNHETTNKEAVVVVETLSPKEQKKAEKAALKAQKKAEKAAQKEAYKLEKQQKKELKKAQKMGATQPPQSTVITTTATGSHYNNVVAPTVTLMKVSPMQ